MLTLRTLLIGTGILLLAAAPGWSVEQAVPAYISAAVGDPERPDEDRARDAARKPAETLAFAEIKPGQYVAELVPGRGYYTRLLSAVVEQNGGHVYALVPERASPSEPNTDVIMTLLAKSSGYRGKVTLVRLNPQAPKLALSLPMDVVWTSLNYHDIHNRAKIDMVAFNKHVFEALNPGGTYVVIDHAAAPRSRLQDALALHRIDAEVVKKEVLAAGFKFVGSSDLLHNSEDPHTVSVLDATIRGKSDQFILKFRKPGVAPAARKSASATSEQLSDAPDPPPLSP